MTSAPATSRQKTKMSPPPIRRRRPYLPPRNAVTTLAMTPPPSLGALALSREPPLERGKDQKHQVEHDPYGARVSQLRFLEGLLVDVLDEDGGRDPWPASWHHVDQVEDVQRVDDVEDQKQEGRRP